MQLAIPVIAILHDHLDVPSILISSACSIESMCVSGSTENVVLHVATGTGNNKTHRIQHHIKHRRYIAELVRWHSYFFYGVR